MGGASSTSKSSINLSPIPLSFYLALKNKRHQQDVAAPPNQIRAQHQASQIRQQPPPNVLFNSTNLESQNRPQQSRQQMINSRLHQNPIPKPQAGVTVMQNDIQLKKNSVKIMKVNSDQEINSFEFQFELDALKPYAITVYFFVTQKLKFVTNLHDSFENAAFNITTEANQCTKGQTIRFKIPKGIFESKDSSVFESKNGFWPIIVRMVTVDYHSLIVLSIFLNFIHLIKLFYKQDRVGKEEQKSLFSYFSIEKRESLLIPILKKQSLEYNYESYEIQEIFGVENTDLLYGEAAESQQKQANMDDCNKECIICMTDLIDTVILPCRHMCICIECAKSLQQKKTQRLCPVCRKEIDSFLRMSKQQNTSLTQKLSESQDQQKMEQQ